MYDAFDYVALGHVHRPQRIGRDTVRYSGSPLKYSFSEARYDKSAVLVELGSKAEGDEELLYANRAVYGIFGCKGIEEFKELTGNTFKGMLLAEDYLRCSASINEQIAGSDQNMDHVIYRIVRRDGEIRWIDDYGHYAETDAYGGVYYVINNNMGYDGDLELAMLTEDFRVYALGEAKDTNNVLVEKSDNEFKPFALLFEFDGDVKHIRHVLYNCTASRPNIEGKTIEENKEVQTETVTIAAVPLPDGTVKAKTGDDTDETTYNGWYGSVYQGAGGGD